MKSTFLKNGDGVTIETKKRQILMHQLNAADMTPTGAFIGHDELLKIPEGMTELQYHRNIRQKCHREGAKFFPKLSTMII